MLKHRLWALALAGALFVPATLRAQFASAVISYDTGTGFASGFTNTLAAVGAPTTGSSVTPFAAPFSNTQLVSIGAGGELTLQLSSAISHDSSRPYGLDFVIYENQFFIKSGTTVSGLFSHTASSVVQVSADGTTWYTLNPTLAPQPGGLFPTDGSGSSLIPVNPSLTLGDFTGQNLAGIRSLYAGSAGGAGYDLAWAQDADGNSVTLANVDFVRIEVASGVLDVDAISVVPEPGISALLLPGLALLAWRHRREKKIRAPRAAMTTAAKILLMLFAATSITRADTNNFTENFTVNPLTNGWQIFGDTNLFQWDATNHDLAVTWDSSQPNSYFYHPLGTVLTTNSDFGLDFDLLLTDATIMGGTFQVAVGLLNLADASDPTFLRGTGFNSTNLVEFDYFMDPVFGNSPTGSENDTNGEFADCYEDLTLNTNTTYHVSITHFAGEPLINCQLNIGPQVFSFVPTNFVEDGFGDFAVDTIVIPNYSDTGAYGASILAHGTVANLAFTRSPNPVGQFASQYLGTSWQATFHSHANWLYTLERSTNLVVGWSAVSSTNGDGTVLTLQDTNAPTAAAFYRVHASHP